MKRDGKHLSLSRRRFLQGASALGVLAGLESLAPAYGRQGTGVDLTRSASTSDVIDLEIRRKRVLIGGREANPVTINGSTPGPVVRLREGTTATIRVTNLLNEDTSIHWHGIILPAHMDGVPGVSFPGIRPGETFTYRYDVGQNGTYWYHSHSGLQEQVGHYGPLIIDPAEPEPFTYDRDYVVMLTDWTFEDPHDVFAKLKKSDGYYNFQKRTVGDLFDDVAEKGWRTALRERAMWGQMRMSSRDLADVTGATYTYLLNGLAPESNWTALFRPGERVRLRFINGSAMSYFDVRIPGLKMTVVQADGQYVQPVTVDEFRIATAETYDVIVEPQEDRAYTLFAESMDRSGYARGTLATRAGMKAPVPERRPMPERSMAAMGHGAHGMEHGASSEMPHGMHDSSSMRHDTDAMGHRMHGDSHDAMDHEMGTGNAHEASHDMHGAAEMSHDMHGGDHGMQPEAGQVEVGPHDHGPGAAMVAENPRSRLHEPGVGLESTPDHRVLVYGDLRSLRPWPDRRKPSREMELHLTGNMHRYMWSFNGRKFSEVEGPIRFHHGERLRLTLVNDTMMDHPIHLHGMWMELDNGAGALKPRKHTLSVKPGEKVSLEITADAPGDWAFHCHLLYHMKAGMMRVVTVS